MVAWEKCTSFQLTTPPKWRTITIMTICDICRADLAGVREIKAFEYTDPSVSNRYIRLDHLCGQCFGCLCTAVRQLIADRQADGLIFMKRKLLGS